MVRPRSAANMELLALKRNVIAHLAKVKALQGVEGGFGRVSCETLYLNIGGLYGMGKV